MLNFLIRLSKKYGIKLDIFKIAISVSVTIMVIVQSIK